MAVETRKYTIQNIEAVTGYSLEDGTLYFRAEDLQSGSMTNAQETVYATGKNGVRISSADRNKTSTFSAENGTIVEGILATQVGSEVETIETAVIPDFYEVIAVAENKAITTYAAVSDVIGNEIKGLYAKNADGTAGKKFGAEDFSYAPETKTITITKGAEGVKEVIVVYDYKVKNVKHVQNRDDKFSKMLRAVFDIICQDVCSGKSYLGKIIYPKGKMSGNFDLTFGNDFSVQKLEIEALSGGCSGAGNVLWDFYVYDADEAV